MSDDDTERYLVQMVPHAPEAPAETVTATGSVVDEVIQRHATRIVDIARDSLSDTGLEAGYDYAAQQIGAAQEAIDGLKGRKVTINIDGAGMFERFTDRARRVVVLAQEEARTLNHNYIGTEHILIALAAEGEGVAARALMACGVDLGECREQVKTLVGKGDQAPSGHIPFTPGGKKVMEYALREALQLGHNFIGTEHILLALIRETEGAGARALKATGCEPETVRQNVLARLAAAPRDTTAPVTPQAVRSGPGFVAAPSMEATVLKGLRVYVDALDAQLRAAGY
jgi:hypothetical protein